MKTKTAFVAFFYFLIIFCSQAQKNYPPKIEDATKVTYKVIDGTSLNLWIFKPNKVKTSDSKPAILFFFGGGWNKGTPAQFIKHCEYLAARGMIAITVDYRVKNRHGVIPKNCVEDAMSAVAWVREHASEYGIDPNRIVAAGASAGGHLAAATATLENFSTGNDTQKISHQPNAVVLFNPVLVLAPTENLSEELNNQMGSMVKRMGSQPENMSPYHNIKAALPPMIIFHGTLDKVVPFETVQLFQKKMVEYDNLCTLIGYQDEPHAFFNFGKKSNVIFVDTMQKIDDFLVSLGYLNAPPETLIFGK